MPCAASTRRFPEDPKLLHLDDDAELYALGLTAPERGAEIEAHLAQCAECCARVAAAEEAAAALSAALPPVPAAPARVRRGWTGALAIAAAVVFAVAAAFEGFTAHNVSTQLAATDTALVALAGSHFNHVSLASTAGVTAKAIYARDGAWYYVVAENAGPGARVVVRKGNTLQDAGRLSAATPGTLFVRNPGRVQEFRIVSGDRVVASAVPAY
jgi:hypothetical protein